MLKVPEHQVAGHQSRNGKLGPLIDDSGHFYKPLQDGTRGETELSFYTSFHSNSHIPKPIRRFFPAFYGTRILDASDGSGPHCHLVLQDLVSNRPRPSIIDIKIGSRTWYPQAPKAYIEDCLKKDRETTSLELGFRISGLQIYGGGGLQPWKPAKKTVKNFSVDDVRSVLRKFGSSDSSLDSVSEADCSLASAVYRGSSGVLSQLLELKAWFEDQTIFHFNSCSVLLLFERDAVLEGRGSGVEVKLVDFAHVMEGRGVIDHNFLGGLCSLIKFITEITQNDQIESRTAGKFIMMANCHALEDFLPHPQCQRPKALAPPLELPLILVYSSLSKWKQLE